MAKAVPYVEPAVQPQPYAGPNGSGGELGAKVLIEGIDDDSSDESYEPGPRYGWPRRPLASRMCGRLWVRAENLLWWTKRSDVPALVTTSPAGTTPGLSGVLGEPGTAILFGDDGVTSGVRSGGRFTLGYWLAPCQCVGIEANYLFLGTGTTRYEIDNSAVPILARPYFDTVLNAEKSLLVAHPAFLAGSVAVDASNDFQAAEVLLRRALNREGCERLDLLLGYRFAQLNDDLAIHQFSRWTRAQGIIQAGTTKDISDSFDTTNQFNGAQLGFVRQRQAGRWSLQTLAKLGLGNTQSTVRIGGRTVTTLPNGRAGTFDGGLLAQTTNIGSYEQNVFSIMPELGVTLGYDITCRLRATCGYTFLYWSRVARPGDVIDHNVSQLPPEPATGSASPAFSWRNTDFWAQGIDFGLAYTF